MERVFSDHFQDQPLCQNIREQKTYWTGIGSLLLEWKYKTWQFSRAGKKETTVWRERYSFKADVVALTVWYKFTGIKQKKEKNFFSELNKNLNGQGIAPNVKVALKQTWAGHSHNRQYYYYRRIQCCECHIQKCHVHRSGKIVLNRVSPGRLITLRTTYCSGEGWKGLELRVSVRWCETYTTEPQGTEDGTNFTPFTQHIARAGGLHKNIRT